MLKKMGIFDVLGGIGNDLCVVVDSGSHGGSHNRRFNGCCLQSIMGRMIDMWIVAVVMMAVGAVTGFLVGVAYGEEHRG